MKNKTYGLFFKTLSNKTRLQIIESLRKKPRNVSELSKILGFEQSRVSHNLRILKEWGFVTVRKSGKTRVYSLGEDSIEPLLDGVDRFLDKYGDKICSCGILSGAGSCTHITGK